MSEQKMDMKISGSSTMPGGEYGSVSISGAGKVQGDLRCERMSCSGASHVDGSVECSGKVSVSGATKILGSLTCGEALHCSGALRCSGDVDTPELRCSGSTAIDGRLTGGKMSTSGELRARAVHGTELSASGSCRIEEGVEADLIRMSGLYNIGGLLNAETVELTAAAGCSVGDIGGSKITVRREVPGLLRRLFSGTAAHSTKVHTIEGDDITLEYVTADVVRGRRVQIGEGCRIGRVEYAETLEAADGTVSKSVRTGSDEAADE